MKIRLVFDTEIEDMDCPTQYDILSYAWKILQERADKADSMDDFADIFSQMQVDGSTQHPGFE